MRKTSLLTRVNRKDWGSWGSFESDLEVSLDFTCREDTKVFKALNLPGGTCPCVFASTT